MAQDYIPTQANWTPADEGMLQQLRSAAKTMVVSVAKTGSSHFNQDVLTFQRQWNVSKPTIIKALAMVKGWHISLASQYFVALKEDGGYGQHTGTALTMIVTPGPKPPLTASQMTLYYANNADFINSLAPAQTTPLPAQLHNTSTASTTTAHTSSAKVAASATYIPKVTKPSGTVSTSKVVLTKKTTASTVKKMNPPVPKQTVPNMSQAQVLDFSQDATPTTVVATPHGTDYKLIAVGVGGVALGGVLFWMLKRRAA